MNWDDILEGVRTVFREYLDIDSGIELETNILYDLQLDSLKMLTLVVELENHFECMFDEGDEKGVETIQELVNLVERYVNRDRCDG